MSVNTNYAPPLDWRLKNYIQFLRQKLYPAVAYTLVETAKFNGVAPQAWFTWVLDQIANPQNQPQRQAPAMALNGKLKPANGVLRTLNKY